MIASTAVAPARNNVSLYADLTGQSPDYITDLLVANILTRSSLRASRNDLFLPRTERRTVDRAFSVAAPRVHGIRATDIVETRAIIDNNFWATFKDLFVPQLVLIMWCASGLTVRDAVQMLLLPLLLEPRKNFRKSVLKSMHFPARRFQKLLHCWFHKSVKSWRGLVPRSSWWLRLRCRRNYSPPQ